MNALYIFTFIIIAIGAYIYAISDQISDAEEICSLYPKGTVVSDFREIEKKTSLRLMRPYDATDKERKQTVLFCATLTMCDTSCSFDVLDSRVIQAKFARR